MRSRDQFRQVEEITFLLYVSSHSIRQCDMRARHVGYYLCAWKKKLPGHSLSQCCSVEQFCVMFIAGANFIRLCSGEDQRVSGGGAGCRGGRSSSREASTARAPLPPDALPYLRGGARLPAPVSLCAPPSRRDTNYRFLALPAYCLIIYAPFADIVDFVAWIFSRSLSDASKATRCRTRVQYTLLFMHCANILVII